MLTQRSEQTRLPGGRDLGLGRHISVGNVDKGGSLGIAGWGLMEVVSILFVGVGVSWVQDFHFLLMI